ncbi:MAG: 4a-hydroxytetrahydrobiopterin dehydratase [Amphritea sp.]
MSANSLSQSNLTDRQCKPCEGGVSALSWEQAVELLAQLADGWELDKEFKEIHKDFKFKGFYRTIAFVNALAWIANNESHHPDLEVGYNHCLVRFSTHAIGGLSENDFICAAKVDALNP